MLGKLLSAIVCCCDTDSRCLHVTVLGSGIGHSSALLVAECANAEEIVRIINSDPYQNGTDQKREPLVKPWTLHLL